MGEVEWCLDMCMIFLGGIVGRGDRWREGWDCHLVYWVMAFVSWL